MVFDVVLGADVRSVSSRGGLGDLDGLRERRDIDEGDSEEGNEERDVLRAALALPFELQVPLWEIDFAKVFELSAGTTAPPLVVGRCTGRAFNAFVTLAS